jgi:hypothetical protein
MKDIKGFEGFYKATEDGKLFSVRSNRFLSLNLKPNGYVYAEFNVMGKISYIRVHRIIAETFIPNPENKEQVNHIDGDKSNNHISNLEWVTQSENALHAIKTGLQKYQYDVFKITTPTGTSYFKIGMHRAAKSIGCCGQTVLNCADRRKISRSGYKIERATTILQRSTAK